MFTSPVWQRLPLPFPLQSAELTKCTFISELSSWHKTFERSLHFNGVLKRWSSTTASSWLGGNVALAGGGKSI